MTGEFEFEALERESAGIVERRDVGAARGLLADDFVLSSLGGAGMRLDRGDWLEALEQIETRSLTVLEVEAWVFGEVAVARALTRWDATMGSRSLTGDYLVTDTFTRSGSRWRPSWRVSVRLSGASRVPRRLVWLVPLFN